MHIASFFASPKPRKQGLPGLTVNKAGQMQVLYPYEQDHRGRTLIDLSAIRTRLQSIEATQTKEAIRGVLGLPMVDTSSPHSLVLKVAINDRPNQSQQFRTFVIVPSNACISELSSLDFFDDERYGGWETLFLRANRASGYSLKTETWPTSNPSLGSIQRENIQPWVVDQAKDISVRLSRIDWEGREDKSGVDTAAAARLDPRLKACCCPSRMKVFGSRTRLMDSLKERSLLGCDGDDINYTENSWGGDISTPCAMVDVLPTLRESRMPSAVPPNETLDENGVPLDCYGAGVTAELDFSKRYESVLITVVAVAPRLPDHKYPVYRGAGLKARISSVWGEMLDC
jgi:hypothetical protein